MYLSGAKDTSRHCVIGDATQPVTDQVPTLLPRVVLCKLCAYTLMALVTDDLTLRSKGHYIT